RLPEFRCLSQQGSSVRKDNETESVDFQAVGRQRVRNIFGNRGKMRFEHRLDANVCERLVRTVLGDFKVLHSSAPINIKPKPQSPDIDQVLLLLTTRVPARSN